MRAGFGLLSRLKNRPVQYLLDSRSREVFSRPFMSSNVSNGGAAVNTRLRPRQSRSMWTREKN